MWVGIVPKGVTGLALNSSFQSRDKPKYKEELGNTLVNLARVIPHGLLVFFSSYAVLSRCVEHWKIPTNGVSIWDRISRHKSPIVEPRNIIELSSAIHEFRESIQSEEGAILFAVCRGKVNYIVVFVYLFILFYFRFH